MLLPYFLVSFAPSIIGWTKAAWLSLYTDSRSRPQVLHYFLCFTFATRMLLLCHYTATQPLPLPLPLPLSLPLPLYLYNQMQYIDLNQQLPKFYMTLDAVLVLNSEIFKSETLQGMALNFIEGTKLWILLVLLLRNCCQWTPMNSTLRWRWQ